MGKVKSVVRERRRGEKLEEVKAARTGVGSRILLCLFLSSVWTGKVWLFFSYSMCKTEVVRATCLLSL